MKQRKSKRNFEVSSGDETPFKDTPNQRRISKTGGGDGELLNYQKSLNVNRVSEMTPSNGLDYLDIEKDHGFEEMATNTITKFSNQHNRGIVKKNTGGLGNSSVKKKRKVRKEATTTVVTDEYILAFDGNSTKKKEAPKKHLSQSTKKGIGYDFGFTSNESPKHHPYAGTDKKEKHVIEGPSEGKIA